MLLFLSSKYIERGFYMDIEIELGQIKDLDELETLYNDINDYLEENINYPGWKKGVYPVREDALNGIENNTLFVVKHDDKIIGSVILNNIPEPEYNKATWSFESDYSDVIIIHTLVVHPLYLNSGLGVAILKFTEEYAMKLNARAVRLDVFEENLPAINLYEKLNYTYIDTINLGYEVHGLDRFKLYEKLI